MRNGQKTHARTGDPTGNAIKEVLASQGSRDDAAGRTTVAAEETASDARRRDLQQQRDALTAQIRSYQARLSQGRDNGMARVEIIKEIHEAERQLSVLKPELMELNRRTFRDENQLSLLTEIRDELRMMRELLQAAMRGSAKASTHPAEGRVAA